MAPLLNIDNLASVALDFIKAADDRGLVLRLSGGLACWLRCPNTRQFLSHLDLGKRDIDLVGRFFQKPRLDVLFHEFGYHNDERVLSVPGIRRSIFVPPSGNCLVDIFYDRLDFCHTIDLRTRLNCDYPTIPLTELFLQKLQIIQLTPRDICHTHMLLRESAIVVGGTTPGIDSALLAALCCKDWGLWRTVTGNITAIQSGLFAATYLRNEDQNIILEKLDQLGMAIYAKPKTLSWKLRSIVGDRLRWYNLVDEV